MRVVGRFQLVLDDYLPVVLVTCPDVQLISADRSFPCFHFKVQVQRFAQYRYILHQPGCEVLLLVLPNAMEVVLPLDSPQVRDRRRSLPRNCPSRAHLPPPARISHQWSVAWPIQYRQFASIRITRMEGWAAHTSDQSCQSSNLANPDADKKGDWPALRSLVIPAFAESTPSPRGRGPG